MSVPVGKRKESKCLAVYNATLIKSEIHDLCCRQLGVKDVDSIIRRNSSYENREQYILELHQSKVILHKYSDMLLAYTRIANRSNLDSVEKCNLKINYQEKSIDMCEIMIGKFQDIVDTFLVDIRKYRYCIQLLDKEISLLKKWEQYVKKVKVSMLQKK